MAWGFATGERLLTDFDVVSNAAPLGVSGQSTIPLSVIFLFGFYLSELRFSERTWIASRSPSPHEEVILPLKTETLLWIYSKEGQRSLRLVF